jgi:phosphoribosylanthranilate isomerase
MAYPTSILIRGINNLSDARYCAGMGADKLSFVLDPSLPGYLEPAVVKELAGWIAGVELIGEFGELSAPEINALATDCALDAVLLRGLRSADELAEIAPPVFIELGLEELHLETDLSSITPAISGLVVELPEVDFSADSDAAGTTLALLGELAEQAPLWLGPGLDPTRARQVLDLLTVSGLVFASGHEIKPGLRDFDQLEAVFEALDE